MNRLYPIYLKMENKLCVIVGGGDVAYRKVKTLMNTGALIRIVSPKVNDKLRNLIDSGKLEYRPKNYSKEDLKGAYIVFVAVDSKELSEKVSEDARSKGAPCNVVDDPDYSDFFVPSIYTNGDLKIAVSTNGKSPALASKIKNEISMLYGKEIAEILNDLGKLRERLKEVISDIEERKNILYEIINKYDFYEIKKNYMNVKKLIEEKIKKWI